MPSHAIAITQPSRRRIVVFLLALISIAGYVTGAIIASKAGSIPLQLMRAATNSRVSISALLFMILLPSFFAALSVSFSKPWIFLLLCFCKTFSFGFSAFAVQELFCSAYWLVQPLFMFTDCWIIFILFYFWIRYLSRGNRILSSDVFACISIATIICGVDYYFVSPFLAELI